MLTLHLEENLENLFVSFSELTFLYIIKWIFN